jgi:hypothetical protein
MVADIVKKKRVQKYVFRLLQVDRRVCFLENIKPLEDSAGKAKRINPKRTGVPENPKIIGFPKTLSAQGFRKTLRL